MEALVEEGVEELRVDVDGAENLLGRAEGLHKGRELADKIGEVKGSLHSGLQFAELHADGLGDGLDEGGLRGVVAKLVDEGHRGPGSIRTRVQHLKSRQRTISKTRETRE